MRFYVDGKLVHRFTGSISKARIESLVAKHSADIDPTAGLVAQINQGFAGMEEAGGTIETAPPRPRPPNAKSLDEAMKPMSKEWLPPGVSKK